MGFILSFRAGKMHDAPVLGSRGRTTSCGALGNQYIYESYGK